MVARTRWQSILTKSLVEFALGASFLVTPLRAQQSPSPTPDPFDVEPPLLVRPGQPESDQLPGKAPEPVSVEELTKQLARAKESAASGERLVRAGVLAKVEAERRAIRVMRLEAELANAQRVEAQASLTLQKGRGEASQDGKADLATAEATLARASAAAANAQENYRKAQLDAAALNLRRQRQLLAQGSARRSDVARAEEKLAALERGEQTSPQKPRNEGKPPDRSLEGRPPWRPRLLPSSS